MKETTKYTLKAFNETLSRRPIHEQLIVVSVLKEVAIRDQKFGLANHFRDGERALSRQVFPDQFMDRMMIIATTGPVGKRGKAMNRTAQA